MTFVPVDPGISEGNYTEWVHKWTHTLPTGLSDYDTVTFHINDADNVLTIWWYDGSRRRFAVYNVDDFSGIFISPAGTDYITSYPLWTYSGAGQAIFGVADPIAGGGSRTLQKYVLIARRGNITIEVWKENGSTPIWSHDITTESPGDDLDPGSSILISATGKYVLVITNGKKLILYEGS